MCNKKKSFFRSFKIILFKCKSFVIKCFRNAKFSCRRRWKKECFGFWAAPDRRSGAKSPCSAASAACKAAGPGLWPGPGRLKEPAGRRGTWRLGALTP